MAPEAPQDPLPPGIQVHQIIPSRKPVAPEAVAVRVVIPMVLEVATVHRDFCESFTSWRTSRSPHGRFRCMERGDANGDALRIRRRYRIQQLRNVRERLQALHEGDRR